LRLKHLFSQGIIQRVNHLFSQDVIQRCSIKHVYAYPLGEDDRQVPIRIPTSVVDQLPNNILERSRAALLQNTLPYSTKSAYVSQYLSGYRWSTCVSRAHLYTSTSYGLQLIFELGNSLKHCRTMCRITVTHIPYNRSSWSPLFVHTFVDGGVLDFTLSSLEQLDPTKEYIWYTYKQCLV
jgi:hypothetical protein